VIRRDLEKLLRADLQLGAVAVLDAHAARDREAHVVEVAIVGAGDRLDVRRPAPARLEDGIAHDAVADLEEAQLAIADAAHLVRARQRLAAESGHPRLLRRV
jgi:hypothetical protein